MKMNLQELGLGINPDEFISVGKYWLWMTVFSTCLFASCGETDRPPQGPAAPEPKAQAVPARYDREVIHTEEIKEMNDLDPEQFEEFTDSNFDDSDLERFKDDDTQTNDIDEVREPEIEDESREVRSTTDSRKDRSETRTEVALHGARDSQTSNEQPSSPPIAYPSPPKATDNNDPEAKWEAQFQVTGDSDDFEPDSSDEFEYVD